MNDLIRYILGFLIVVSFFIFGFYVYSWKWNVNYVLNQREIYKEDPCQLNLNTLNELKKEKKQIFSRALMSLSIIIILVVLMQYLILQK